MTHPYRNRITMASLLVAITIAGFTATAARASTPDVVAPNQRTAGQSYSQWGNHWWQWVDSIPASVSPLTDTDGTNCAENQSGPVWYLAGSSGGSYNRACTVPAGKYIFFPLANSQEDAREAVPDLAFFQSETCPDVFGADNCATLASKLEPINPNHMRQLLDFFYTDVLDLLADPSTTGLFAEVDGEAVPNVGAYRFDSGGGGYTITLPDTEDPYDNYHSVFGYSIPGPDTYMGAQVGYYVMLKPLSAGSHTVSFGRPGWVITYDLEIE